MNKTRIEWCDRTWNPVTGCLHGCEYCYARRIAKRFGTFLNGFKPEERGLALILNELHRLYELDKPVRDETGRVEPYPANFYPTLHRYKLDEPQGIKTPQNIFVCSMADLFGDWVPDEWIEQVFEACVKAPQHRYLFLTKNPNRYLELARAGILPEQDNFWYGTSIPTPDTLFWWSDFHNTFVSIEPMLKAFPPAEDSTVKKVGWAIMGAMTGPGSKKHQPKKAWVESFLSDAVADGIPVFMKDSLIPIVGEENMKREFPWGR